MNKINKLEDKEDILKMISNLKNNKYILKMIKDSFTDLDEEIIKILKCSVFDYSYETWKDLYILNNPDTYSDSEIYDKIHTIFDLTGGK